MYIINDEKVIEPKIVLDAGYFFGKGVFETILLHRGIPIMLDLHLKRLNKGLEILNIKQPQIKEEYVLSMIKKGGYYEGVLKIMVSEKNIIFSTRELNYKEDDYKNGFSVKISNVRRNESSSMTFLKSFNYYENILEKQKGKQEGYDEVIFLNSNDYITEGATTNIFFIKEDKICTPKIDTGILNGTVRGFLIDTFCGVYKFEEGYYNLEDLYRSDGVFLTNSLLGIIKVKSINNKQIKQSLQIDELGKLYRKTLGI